MFDFIRAHGLLPQLPSRVPQLLRIDASQAIHLLVEEREAVSPSAVVPAIQVTQDSVGVAAREKAEEGGGGGGGAVTHAQSSLHSQTAYGWSPTWSGSALGNAGGCLSISRYATHSGVDPYGLAAKRGWERPGIRCIQVWLTSTASYVIRWVVALSHGPSPGILQIAAVSNSSSNWGTPSKFATTVQMYKLPAGLQGELDQSRRSGDSSQAAQWRKWLHMYLDELFQHDSSAGAEFHALQVMS